VSSAHSINIERKVEMESKKKKTEIWKHMRNHMLNHRWLGLVRRVSYKKTRETARGRIDEKELEKKIV